jgi:OmpA-OmpF porin, OOP family
MTLRQISIVVAATALLGACGGMELGTAQKTAPTGDAFSQALYKEYISLSKDEYAEGDYKDSDAFAMRAIAAAGGKPTAPEAPNARPQPATPGKLITAAHGRLVKALAGPGAAANPADAARAQAMYECWAQEQEENYQPEDIDRCRIQFFISLAKIETAVAAKPAPKAMMSPQTFLVYFGFNSTTLDAKANSVLGAASNVIKTTKPKVVSVTGHTDRAGASDYNSALAEKRADVVAAALTKLGISGRLLTIGSLGENANAVETKDGMKESGNRRVEVTVRY